MPCYVMIWELRNRSTFHLWYVIFSNALVQLLKKVHEDLLIVKLYCDLWLQTLQVFSPFFFFFVVVPMCTIFML